MLNVPSFVPADNPPDTHSAITAAKLQLAFALLWHQCKTGIQVDTSRSHCFAHGVVEALTVNWSKENVGALGDICEFIMEAQENIQGTLEDGPSIEIHSHFDMEKFNAER